MMESFGVLEDFLEYIKEWAEGETALRTDRVGDILFSGYSSVILQRLKVFIDENPYIINIFGDKMPPYLLTGKFMFLAGVSIIMGVFWGFGVCLF